LPNNFSVLAVMMTLRKEFLALATVVWQMYKNCLE